MNLAQHDCALLAAPPGISAARAQVYSVLSALCAAPEHDILPDTAALLTAARLAELRDWLLRLEVANTQLPFDSGLHAIVACGLTVNDATALASYQTAYRTCFDGDGSGVASNLNRRLSSGAGEAARSKIMRFYSRYGYEPGSSPASEPTQLPVLLEFLHYLTWLEATAEGADDPAELRVAQFEFLARHVCLWLPGLATTLERRTGNLFLRRLFRGAARFAQADRRWLASGIG